MIDREKLRRDLIRDEGLKLTAYQDTLGYWTIGVGHLLGESKRMDVITPRECQALLDADILDASVFLSELVDTTGLDEVRHRALVNMAFNLGGKLKQFKRFLGAVRAKDWEAAGEHMADSLWARQVGDRAVRLRKMIEEGAA